MQKGPGSLDRRENFLGKMGNLKFTKKTYQKFFIIVFDNSQKRLI